MNILGKYFRTGKNNLEEQENVECPYPLDELRGHIGEIIKVERINQDIPKVNGTADTGILQSSINGDFFYLGDEEHPKHIFMIDWYRKGYGGKVDGVISIKVGGKEIYRNNELDAYSKTLLS